MTAPGWQAHRLADYANHRGPARYTNNVPAEPTPHAIGYPCPNPDTCRRPECQPTATGEPCECPECRPEWVRPEWVKRAQLAQLPAKITGGKAR
jgi:hypothetical protein